MKRVLYVVTNIRVSNGVTSVIMNHYEKLLAAGYAVDFCAMYNWGSPYVNRVLNNGSHYYVLPQMNGVSSEVVNDDVTREGKPDEKKSRGFMEKLMRDNKYDIVHVHILGRYALMALKAAKKYKVPYRIFHSHNPKYINNVHSLLHTLYYDSQCVWLANRYLACSSLAGTSMFGKRKFSIIRNTIDTDRIKFDPEGRKIVRNEFGVSDEEILFGTVCRHTDQKNPYFTVDIYEQIHKKLPNSKFIWVGSGELELSVKEYVKSKKLENFVIFAGNRSDVAQCYSAMDTFILPSKFEGLGIVYIEAQSCGTSTFASDVVPKDTKVTDLIHYISLERTAEEWADIICENVKENCDRERYCSAVKAAGYDRNSNDDLLRYYDESC